MASEFRIRSCPSANSPPSEKLPGSAVIAWARTVPTKLESGPIVAVDATIRNTLHIFTVGESNNSDPEPTASVEPI
jgi:hypothetical protein